MHLFLYIISSSQVIWWVLIVLGILLAIVVIRFFWTHVLRYLFQGCFFILALVTLLAVLQYYKVIHITWPF